MKRKLHAPDYQLIGVTIFLVVAGLIILSSASSVLGFQKFGDTFYYLKRQVLFGLLPGIVAFFVLYRIDYQVWKKYSFSLLLLSILLLVAVFVPGIGQELGGSRSWIIIGGFSLQPSEIVKLTFLLYLAGWLEKRSQGISDMMVGLVPFTVILTVIAGLIILQPDIGTLTVIVAISLIAYFAAGAPIAHLASIGALGIAGFVALIKAAPYRMARLTVFLQPDTDVQGIGYQLRQSILAVGSGGLFGLGLGYSRQKFAYLPEVAGDSIFAIAAEELGFFVSTIIVIAFVYFVMRGLRIARYAPDMYGRIVATGIVGWIGWQAFVNMGAIIGLLPLTGIPLPFISHGGTALMTTLAAFGILINISRQTGHIIKKSSARRWKKPVKSR